MTTSPRRRLAFVFATAAALLPACEGRPRPDGKTEPPKRSGPRVAVFDLSGGVPEQDKGSLFAVTENKRSFDELLRDIERIEEDKESVAVLVKLGYVSGNLMTHLLPASDKLRRRAEWIVMELAGVSREEASRLLAETEGDTQAAVDLGLRGRV